MDWFVSALKRYAVFRGRAGRPEYWYFTLIYLLVSVLLAVLDVIAGTFDHESATGLFSTIFGLAVLLPAIAVTVRRLHDTGRSGWWVWIGLIPLVGIIVLLVFLVRASAPGANAYGEGPAPAL